MNSDLTDLISIFNQFGIISWLANGKGDPIPIVTTSHCL